MTQAHSRSFTSSIPQITFSAPTDYSDHPCQYFSSPHRDFAQTYTYDGPDTPKNMSMDYDDEMYEDDEDFESDEEGEEEELDEDESEDDDIGPWATNPKRLRQLEELRWWFVSELNDPSAWTLQRIKSLIQSNRTFEAREVVKQWLYLVAESTDTPPEGELRLPYMEAPEDMPFHKVLTWEEAGARGYCFEREVEEKYKRDARLTILFLFPEAHTKGLSAVEKKRLFTVASRVWMVHYPRAEGLLWVLGKEYPDTREEVGQVRDWANSMSQDFMTYAALYPPPIFVGH